MRKPDLAAFCSWMVMVLCATVLAGWHFDLVVLRSLLPQAPPTTPLTAAVLLTLSAALAFSGAIARGARAPGLLRGVRTLAGASVLASLWVGLQYLLELPPGFELLFYSEAVQEYGGAFPGRPSPQTIAATTLIGLSVGLVSVTRPGMHRVAVGFALVGMFLPWLALFGYAATVGPLYALPDYPETGMSPITALGLLTLGIGVMALRPEHGLIGLMRARSPGGQLIRRLLPVVLMVPLFFGWLVAYGNDIAMFSTATGFGISWGVTSVFLAILVIRQGFSLHEYDTQLRFQADALERSNLELRQFAYIASHDLQAPLRSISGFVQLLKQGYHGKLDAEAHDWIDRTVISANHMQMMIHDILAYARVDTGNRPFEPIWLREVADEVVSVILADAIREADATVSYDGLPRVMGDRTMLVPLLQNLIGNALKYRGNEPPRVQISAWQQGLEWTIAVSDNGIGIEPQHQERIFEIFRRLHGNNRFPGTGIGLAICRRVVERHGGRIWVKSRPGHGSTFHFSLPTMRSAGDDAP